MNKHVKGTLSAVLMASVVLGGIGNSTLVADAKTTSTAKVVVSAKDKKAVSTYVKKAKSELGTMRETLSDMKYDTLYHYNDKEDYFGEGKFKVMESTSYKAESLYVQKLDKENTSLLKKMTEANKKLVSELSKVKTVADVTKHRKSVSLFKKQLANVKESVSETEEEVVNLSDSFDRYMEKQFVLSKIIYGDDFDKTFSVDTSYLAEYEETIDYEIAIGKRADISETKRYALNENLVVASYEMLDKDYSTFSKSYVYKLAKGDLVGAHKDYVTYTTGAYKIETEKWNALVKKEYDKAFKLK